MTKVLISGGAAHEALRWADGLGGGGLESSIVGERSLVPVVEAIPARTVGGYVQLPPVTVPAGDLAERLRALALIAPLLADDATVVIVAGDPADRVCDPLVTAAFRTVIDAAAGKSAAPARVSVHVGPWSEGALAAGWPGGAPSGSSGPLADYGPGLTYTEWRNDLLSLTSGVEATYIGWTTGDGRPKVGVLRGAVVSPLTTHPEVEFGWADCGAGAHRLGDAILADAVGSAWRSVDESIGDVVGRFVKEIVDRLPSDGFELSAADVRAWLRRQYLP